MTKNKLAGILILLAISTPVFWSVVSAQTITTSTAQSLSRQELEAQVQAKAKQLDDINKQMEATKQNLKGTTAERLTLQKQLNTIQGNINQLDLGIKSDQITVQKLNLEVTTLGYDIQDIQSSASDKKAAIEKLLVELQKSDRDNNLLAVFLRNGSLADGILEAQTLSNLQGQLATDVVDLSNLSEKYNNKIQEADNKKSDITSHQQDLANKKSIVEDQKNEQQQILKSTKDKESVFQQQLTELEKEQQQIASEVDALDAVLRTKIDPSLLPTPGHAVLVVPVWGDDVPGDITQGYGATAFAKNGYAGHWHNGIDFAATIGTPILAADDGEVLATGNQDAYCYKGAYGKFIVIKHANNLTTLYGHLSKQIVAKGATVKRGQVIGYSGMTGYATGPHLHFTVFAGPTFYIGPSRVCGPMPYGGDLNPLSYL